MSKINGLTRTFGVPAAAQAATTPAAQRPKAEFWLNIGYDSGIQQEDGETWFVSLGQGIPLDQIEDLKTTGRNAEYNQFMQARNDLRDQLLEAAKQLEPGNAVIINPDDQLQIQLRRIGGEPPAPTGENQFARKLFGA
jgi:hypothetical protein